MNLWYFRFRVTIPCQSILFTLSTAPLSLYHLSQKMGNCEWSAKGKGTVLNSCQDGDLEF